jgi:hypothetical protein
MVKEYLQRSLEIVKAPTIEIALFGDSLARVAFETFTKRHPRCPLIRYKTWGVALLKLAATFQEYLACRKGARRHRNKCLNAGYEFRQVDALNYLEDVLTINRSSLVRQGQAMSKEYLEPHLVRSHFFETGRHIFGVFRRDGKLVAYHHAVMCGDVYVSDKLLGHADDLRQGVMYYLMMESVRTAIDSKNKHGYPNWAMYDTTWGASEGMLRFKSRLGYVPHNVKWVWRESPIYSENETIIGQRL